MAGVQKIIETIQGNSKAVCDSVLKDAENQAAQIAAAKAEEAKKASEKIEANAAQQAKDIVAAAVSGSELEQKKALLAAKVELINEVIDKVAADLKSLPDDQYFTSLGSLVKKYARGEEGVMYLSKKDLDRLPAGFEQTVNGLLPAGSIKISSEPRDIDGGFILAYGGIEINCGFDALIAESRDDMKDELSRILFA